MYYYVYILTSESNKMMYIGITNDLKRRLYEHLTEINEGYTKKFHVHKLVYYEKYGESYYAIEREKQLKKWSRKKKDFLVETKNPQWEDIGKKYFPELYNIIKN